MNSCLYKATIMHHRTKPKSHGFHYKVFMFYIDLDELTTLQNKFIFFSRNRFNFFSFRDNEHLQLPEENPDKTKSTREHILTYLNQNGIAELPEKIMLLTNLNVLGYNFNPVSFYYCFNKNDTPICCIAEVSNTFREIKPFLLSHENFDSVKFHLNTAKLFYVSPFIDHDAHFDFNLAVPGEKLNIRIDDYKDGARFFISTLTGNKKQLTNSALIWYSLRFPLLPLWIMGQIHWQAFLLWLKKIHYHKKSENMHLQKGVFRKHSE